MQPVQKKQQLERKPRSRAWKKKFECKKGKGDHKLVLVKPNYYRMEKYETLTPLEYYAVKEVEYAECMKRRKGTGEWCGMFPPLKYYECTVCGKRELKQEKR